MTFTKVMTILVMYDIIKIILKFCIEVVFKAESEVDNGKEKNKI